jgi:hypothetical protein
MIQPVPKSKKERKSISRQVNLAISSPPATTEYLRWSDQPVRFSRADHPRKVPRPGHAPMVLKAQIGGYDVGRVFMDAGSGINLIYARTLKAMCISLESLKPIDCSFHGIVPGGANYHLRKIELDICFGNSNNYRREKLEFEVMDWLHSIMESWDAQHLQNSWQYLILLRWCCCKSPSRWELQEEGMMSIAANFPSVRNQGLSYPGKSQTPEGDAC